MLNEFRYPLSSEPRPGPRTFATRVAPDETYVAAEHMMIIVRPNMKAKMSNTRVFQDFVWLNERIDASGNHTPLDALLMLMLWTVDLLRQE